MNTVSLRPVPRQGKATLSHLVNRVIEMLPTDYDHFVSAQTITLDSAISLPHSNAMVSSFTMRRGRENHELNVGWRDTSGDVKMSMVFYTPKAETSPLREAAGRKEKIAMYHHGQSKVKHRGAETEECYISLLSTAKSSDVALKEALLDTMTLERDLDRHAYVSTICYL